MRTASEYRELADGIRRLAAGVSQTTVFVTLMGAADEFAGLADEMELVVRTAASDPERLDRAGPSLSVVDAEGGDGRAVWLGDSL